MPRRGREALTIRRPVNEVNGAVRFGSIFKVVKDVLPGSVPAFVRSRNQETFFAFRAQLRPKTAQDGLKIAQDDLKIGR